MSTKGVLVETLEHVRESRSCEFAEACIGDEDGGALCSARRSPVGEGGDVFEAVGAPYVLKVLQPELHEVLGGKTVGARPGALEKVMANIYGVLTNTWPGKSVGVVVVERVPHAMRSWFHALMTLKPIPDTISVDLVFRLTAQF